MIAFLWDFWLHHFWLVAFLAEMVILFTPPLFRRMQNGVIRRYLRRRFGFFAPALAVMVLMIVFVGAAISFLTTGYPDVGAFLLSSYWTIFLSWMIIDVITGGDKPKRWRKKAAELVKKLRISAPPRPIARPA